jgi:hypothetical protein
LLLFDYVGIPVGKQNEAELDRIRRGPIRRLTATETHWLEHLLNEQGIYPIKLSTAATREINEEKVFDVTGRYNYAEGENSPFESLYIDVDGSASFLQRITFIAPPELFAKYKKQANQFFDSLRWLSDPDIYIKNENK